MKKILPLLIYGLIVSYLAGVNYAPNSFLSGWDNLHPEFNFLLNIKRSLFSLWQEYQGLGLLGGMGYAADLPRQIFLLFSSLFFPTHFLRFFFTYLMLFLGPSGIYFLLSNLLPNEPAKQRLFAFLGGLFYLLNLATVQIFFVPFETFVSFYAFLPWLLNLVFQYLSFGTKKLLVYFLILSIVSTSQYYVPTLFVVYFASLLLIFAGFYLKNKQIIILKRSLKLLLVTFIANSFWLIPFLYFSFTSSYKVAQAHSNYISTESIYLRNKEFGNLKDVALLKGYWFNFVDRDPSGNTYYMISSWRGYLNSPLIQIIGYFFFLVIILGLIKQFRSKNDYSYPLIFLFIFSFSILANNTFPFSFIMNFFTERLPFFGQVFRVPFTKFSNLLLVTYSIYFSFGILWISQLGNKLKIKALIVSLLLVIYMFPLFKGQLVSSSNQVAIPSDYFNLVSYLNKQSLNSRIMVLPQYSYWGWNYYFWGYRGSGFLWYGLKHPLLDRAFDVWSNYNENFYWELSYALYSKQINNLYDILNKYQVGWIIVDENITGSVNPKALYLDNIREILGQIPNINLDSQFGKIKLYKINLYSYPNQFIYLSRNLPRIEPIYNWNNFDLAYLENGDYISSGQTDIYYPFRSLFTGRKQEELEFKVSEKDNSFIFEINIPKELVGGQLVIPDFVPEDLIEPEIFLDEGKLQVVIPKISGEYSYDTDQTGDLINRTPKNCNLFNNKMFKHELLSEKNKQFLRLTSVSSGNCLDFNKTSLPQKLGYLIKLETRHIEGSSLLAAVNNINSDRTDLETYLSKTTTWTENYLIQPPMDPYGLGYSVYIDNNSIGDFKTVNDLGRITINPIPYHFLTGIKIISNDWGQTLSQPVDSSQFEVSHPNPSYYKISIKYQVSSINNTLVLSQAFDTGWKAYQVDGKLAEIFPFIFGKEIKEHVLVNNWENGWKLTTNDQQPKTIIVYYLPQLLEYLGLVILIVGFVWIVRRK